MEALAWLAHPYLCPQPTRSRRCGACASAWYTGQSKSVCSHLCDLERVRESIPIKPVRAHIFDWHGDVCVRGVLITRRMSQMCVNVRGKGSGEGSSQDSGSSRNALRSSKQASRSRADAPCGWQPAVDRGGRPRFEGAALYRLRWSVKPYLRVLSGAGRPQEAMISDDSRDTQHYLAHTRSPPLLLSFSRDSRLWGGGPNVIYFQISPLFFVYCSILEEFLHPTS